MNLFYHVNEPGSASHVLNPPSDFILKQIMCYPLEPGSVFVRIWFNELVTPILAPDNPSYGHVLEIDAFNAADNGQFYMHDLNIKCASIVVDIATAGSPVHVVLVYEPIKWTK